MHFNVCIHYNMCALNKINFNRIQYNNLYNTVIFSTTSKHFKKCITRGMHYYK